VAVEQLHDRRRDAERVDRRERARIVHRIDEPDRAVVDERVRGPLNRLVERPRQAGRVAIQAGGHRGAVVPVRRASVRAVVVSAARPPSGSPAPAPPAW
jgi:hypothetical protein